MRRRTAVVLATAAVLAGGSAAVVVPLATEKDASDGAIGPITPGAAVRAAHAAVSRPPAPRPSAPRPSAPRPSAPRPSASTASREPSAGGTPVRVSIAATAIAARVVPVGVDAAGDVAVPDRVDEVGWYRWSARPGDPAGSAVLVGHVDSATEGTGAFFHLATVPAGARVTVTVRGNRRIVYRVVGRELFAKPAVPLDTLFARTGTPRLTLITCGGPFDPAALSYRDNVVLTAVPVRP